MSTSFELITENHSSDNCYKGFHGSKSNIKKTDIFPADEIDIVDKLVDDLIKENQEVIRDRVSSSTPSKGKKKMRRRDSRNKDSFSAATLDDEELIYDLLEASTKSDKEEENELPAPPNSPSSPTSKNSLLILEHIYKIDNNDCFGDFNKKFFKQKESTPNLHKNTDSFLDDSQNLTRAKVNDYLSIKLPTFDIYPFLKRVKSQINLQNIWVLSHLLTIVGISLYVYSRIFYNADLEFFSYKLGTLSSVLTYLIVLYRANFEEQIVQFNEKKDEVIVKTKVMTISEFVKNENAQLLGFVILWYFTPMSIVKLAPFVIYSTLNLTSFFTLEVIPNYSFSIAVLPLLSYLEVPLLIAASHFDLIAFGVVFYECYEVSNAYPFVIFTFLWLLRYESSEACRSSVNLIIDFLLRLFAVFTSLHTSLEHLNIQVNNTCESHNYVSKGSGADVFTEDGGSSATLTVEGFT